MKVTVVVMAFGREIARQEVSVHGGETLTLHADDAKVRKAAEAIVLGGARAQFRATDAKKKVTE